jgi:hypothetical protein
MGQILLAEAAVFAELKLLFHFFLVTLGVVRNAAATRALEFHQRIFDLSHTSIDKIFYKAFPLYVKTGHSSTFLLFLSR